VHVRARTSVCACTHLRVCSVLKAKRGRLCACCCAPRYKDPLKVRTVVACINVTQFIQANVAAVKEPLYIQQGVQDKTCRCVRVRVHVCMRVCACVCVRMCLCVRVYIVQGRVHCKTLGLLLPSASQAPHRPYNCSSCAVCPSATLLLQHAHVLAPSTQMHASLRLKKLARARMCTELLLVTPPERASAKRRTVPASAQVAALVQTCPSEPPCSVIALRRLLPFFSSKNVTYCEVRSRGTGGDAEGGT